MDRTPYASPLHLELRPSPRFRALYLLAHAAAGGAVVASAAPGWLVPLLGGLIAAAGVYGWRRQPALGGQRPRLSWGDDGRWSWGERAGLELDGDTYLSQPVIVLLLRRTGGQRVGIVIPADALDAESLRRLRVRLRLHRFDGGAETGQPGR